MNQSVKGTYCKMRAIDSLNVSSYIFLTHKSSSAYLRVPIVRNHGRQCEPNRKQVQSALLGKVVAELYPASSIKNRSVKTALASAKQPNAVFVCRVHSRAKTVFVLRTLTAPVDPRLSLWFAAGAPVINLLSFHPYCIGWVLCNLRDRFMREPLFLPRTGNNPRLSKKTRSELACKSASNSGSSTSWNQHH